MKKSFPFLILSLLLLACNSSPYQYYSSGSQCDENYDPNPVAIPSGTSGTFVDITNSLNNPQLLPPGTYNLISLQGFFHDRTSDLHVFVIQGIDLTNPTVPSNAVYCVRNYFNVTHVPSSGYSPTLTAVMSLTVDSNQNITAAQTQTMGYSLVPNGIVPKPGLPQAMTAPINLASISAVYQNMDSFKIYKFTDTDGTVNYQIRAQKVDPGNTGFVLQEIKAVMQWAPPQ